MAPTAERGNGPRIYDLFPSLAGTVEAWTRHIPRIAGMGFDWIYLNPFHHPGFSGSLYAVKDYYRLHDLFAADGNGDGLLARFTADAQKHGVRVMMDAVLNHTSKDALLVAEHPEWYKRDEKGDLYSPRATDPSDPSKVTVWGDLAELDYSAPSARKGLVEYWSRYLRHYIDLGFRGFRCDAAYKISADIWRSLIGNARARGENIAFFAETLGCGVEEIEALHEAGFDYLFNSSKWWDFRSDWLLEQYEAFRRIAPSISFPESHDTERLAAELGASDPEHIVQHAKQRYLFAACFSTGIMIPIGYEYGFGKKLDVVHTRPEDWETPTIDISDFIAATNAMKKSIPALNEEGPQRRITAPHADILGLHRLRSDRSDGCALILLNADGRDAHSIDPGFLLSETGGIYDGFRDVTPQASPLALRPGQPITLDPLELRVFIGKRADAPVERRSHGEESLQRLENLAADRVVIEEVWPEIDGGRHPVKRVVGDVLEVWADIFCDGHEKIAAAIRYRDVDEPSWSEEPMVHYDNDRWLGHVPLSKNTRYVYTIKAWRDLFQTWRQDVTKKMEAGQSIDLELIEGRRLVEAADKSASGRDKRSLQALLGRLTGAEDRVNEDASLLLSEELRAIMARVGPRANLSRYGKELEVVVDRLAARYGAWYEMFPRSASGDPSRHGTFQDVRKRLSYVRDMGFDVIYFPPIHPIGRTNRKGRNNSPNARAEDPGSPWAIGSEAGGHTEIHPELGSLEDFAQLLRAIRDEGMEIALDFAIQCSPDHPWIRAHPEWFDWRPDGSIKFAENPPKKYEDIVNVHFYRGALPGLWLALRDAVLFWVRQGVRIFRVDNPHTKPVPFWEWLIREVQNRYPDVVFLAEAFTRPKMMRKLAKIGFSQSYSYFTWRHSKSELTEYLTELTQFAPKEYMRANFFVNTPDINPPFLQAGGRPAFMIRAILAATLSSLWGIYSGFEICEATAIPGREEYLNSEKYEIKNWDWDRPGNIRAYIARLNRIRRDNPALHQYTNLKFYTAHSDDILFYGKASPSSDNILWIAVNLDPHNAHEAALALPLQELRLAGDAEIEIENLLDGSRLRWRGPEQRIRLDPHVNPGAIWRVTPPRQGPGGGA